MVTELKKVFKNNVKLKEVHIDIFSENPLNSSTSFMLLLRASEKNALISNDDNRLILKRNDRDKTYIMNILFSEIKECFHNGSKNYNEFILNVQNIYYKITILN